MILELTVRVSASLSPIVAFDPRVVVDVITRLSAAASPRLTSPNRLTVLLNVVAPLKVEVPPKVAAPVVA